MTMTPERLAELDAVMAMLGKAPLWKTGQWFERNAADIRAHIDAQAATIARQDEALNIAHTAFADCDQSNPMQVEAIAIVRAALTGAA